MLEEVNGLLCAADACPEVSVGTDHSVASFEQRGISLTLNQKIDGPAGIVVNGVFFIFLFLKIIFYRNIFLVS